MLPRSALDSHRMSPEIFRNNHRVEYQKPNAKKTIHLSRSSAVLCFAALRQEMANLNVRAEPGKRFNVIRERNTRKLVDVLWKQCQYGPDIKALHECFKTDKDDQFFDLSLESIQFCIVQLRDHYDQETELLNRVAIPKGNFLETTKNLSMKIRYVQDRITKIYSINEAGQDCNYEESTLALANEMRHLEDRRKETTKRYQDFIENYVKSLAELKPLQKEIQIMEALVKAN